MKSCKLAVAVGLVLAAGCGPKMDWKEFTGPDGKFTVLMPGTPKEQSQPAPVPGLTVKMYMVDLGSSAFAVSTTDLPPGTPFDYTAGVQGAIQGYQGKLLSSTDVTIGGSKGKAFEAEIAKPKGYVSGQMVVVNNRLYQLIAIGSNARTSNPDVQKFFDSFKLAK